MRPWVHFLFLLLNSGDFLVQDKKKIRDKTIQTFKKGEKVNLNRIWKEKQQMYCQNARRKKKKNMSHRWGFYLYISCACQHQTFNVSILQRHRRKEERCKAHIVITQSNSHPLLQTACSSAQLAPDTHITINISPNVVLTPHRAYTDTMHTDIKK